MELREILGFYGRRGYGQAVGAGARPALLVIDFSKAFTGGQGAFPGGSFTGEMAAVGRLAAAARAHGPVIYTTIAYGRDMRDAGLWARKVPWLEVCQMGSPAVEIDPAAGLAEGDVVLVKKYPSAFFGTTLHADLQGRGVDTLVVTGCTTSVCVRATVVDGMQHGYRMLVVREGVGDFDEAIHDLHLADIGARYGDVIGMDEALACLSGRVLA